VSHEKKILPHAGQCGPERKSGRCRERGMAARDFSQCQRSRSLKDKDGRILTRLWEMGKKEGRPPRTFWGFGGCANSASMKRNGKQGPKQQRRKYHLQAVFSTHLKPRVKNRWVGWEKRPGKPRLRTSPILAGGRISLKKMLRGRMLKHAKMFCGWA